MATTIFDQRGQYVENQMKKIIVLLTEEEIAIIKRIGEKEGWSDDEVIGMAVRHFGCAKK